MSQIECSLVSVVIPVYNQVRLLDRCLLSLDRQIEVCLQVIVVDDASPQDPAPIVRGHPAVHLLKAPHNLGYAAANNLGLVAAQGDYLLFFNSDTELPAAAICRLVDYLKMHPDTAAVSPLHLEPGGGVQHTCYRFPTLSTGLIWDSAVHERRPDHPVCQAYTMADWDHQTERWVEHAQTSCLLIRRAVYESVGGMDEKLRLFYNDTDFCRRIYAAGYRIRFVPSVAILHHGGASVRTFDGVNARLYIDRYRYFRKWFGWRGGLAVRSALWSRVLYHGLAELSHGQVGAAARRFARGARLHHALGGSQ